MPVCLPHPYTAEVLVPQQLMSIPIYFEPHELRLLASTVECDDRIPPSLRAKLDAAVEFSNLHSEHEQVGF